MADDFEFLFSRTATDPVPGSVTIERFRKIRELESEIAAEPRCERINKQTIEKIRSEIVTSNTRLIARMVHNMSLDPAHMSKWYSAGCVGLVKAVNKFDISYTVKGKPVAFSTYACRCIQTELLSELEHHGGMWRRNMTRKIWAVTKALEYLNTHGNTNPTDEELLDAIRVCWEIRRKAEGKSTKKTTRYATPLITTIKDVQVCRRAQAMGQIDMFGAKGKLKRGRDERWSPADDIDRLNIDEVDNTEFVNIILDAASPRTRRILKLTHGIGCDVMPQKKIGQKYGITRIRVTQILKEFRDSVAANFTSPYESPVCRQTSQFPQHGSCTATPDSVLRV